jgi:hypothetical protein
VGWQKISAFFRIVPDSFNDEKLRDFLSQLRKESHHKKVIAVHRVQNSLVELRTQVRAWEKQSHREGAKTG